jgi:hypothetical protein
MKQRESDCVESGGNSALVAVYDYKNNNIVSDALVEVSTCFGH